MIVWLHSGNALLFHMHVKQFFFFLQLTSEYIQCLHVMDSDVKKLLSCKLLSCKIKSKSVVISMLWLGDNKTKFKFKECVDWYSFWNSFRSEEEKKMDPKLLVIAVIVIALSIAIIGFIVFAVWKRNWKKPKRRQSLEKPKPGKIYWFEKTMFIIKVFT